MELNQTVSILQEEMKLLKGEIKTVLKDIRSAVLSSDNPFTLDMSAVAALSAPSGAAEAPPETEGEEPEPSPLTLGVPSTPPAGEPGAPTAAAAPTPLRSGGRDEPAEQAGPHWNLLTIAGLMTWAEQAVATLGTQRFEIVLELACFAEVITPDVRDVLVRVGQLAPVKDTPNQPMNVIEGLVVLHELEAILHGEKITKLPRRRSERAPGSVVWSSA